MNGLREKLIHPGTILGGVALLVALSGAGYAIANLPKNSVGTAQLKSNSVTPAKLRADSVTGAKVKNGSLSAQDFAPGTLLQGARGETGPQGATGPQGVFAIETIDGTVPALSWSAGLTLISSAAAFDTTGSESITLTATAMLGRSDGSAVYEITPCIAANPSGTWAPFQSGGPLYVRTAAGVTAAQPVVGAVTPAAGSWRVGVCADPTTDVNDNGGVRGLVQLVNVAVS